LKELWGSVGNFTARIEQAPRYVDPDKCTACGVCASYCPVHPLDEFNQNLCETTAVHIPYTQAVPAAFTVDKDHCLFLTRKECKQCTRACQAQAIDFSQRKRSFEVNVGAVILSPGFSLYDLASSDAYGYRQAPNVVSAMEFERISNASGPYSGHILRPSDLSRPDRIAFIQCVGSRDIRTGNSHCSSVCCKIAVKDAIVALEHEPDLDITIFYMDMRMFGKGFETFFWRAKDAGVRFVRSRVADLTRIAETEDLRLRYVTDEGALKDDLFSLVVLPAGFEPPEKATALATAAQIELDPRGFCKTNLFSPVETSRKGVFVAGTFQSPKSIPESVVDGSGAAASAAELLHAARGALTKVKELPTEKPVEDSPRIGVFVCYCGKNIAGTVDVEEVRRYAENLPGVVYAATNLYSCSQDAQDLITARIAEQNLNRVVVAACTPRTHEPLFQETARNAGLNRCLVEMTNIRDQCSWVHMSQPEDATEKSKDLVRMAVAKAGLVQALPETEMEVIQKGLVIGGGLAGMTAALSLADQGFECFLIEQAKGIGGMLRSLHSTLEGDDPKIHLGRLSERVFSHEKIRVFTEAEIEDIDGFVGNFATTISVPGGTDRESLRLEHGAIIVATGAQVYRPDQYLFGKNPNVILQLELERRIAIASGDGIKALREVVMIQCVGSRDESHPYCSGICCSHAVKNALKLKEINPSVRVTILYRDMMTYGFHEDYYTLARDRGINFVRYDPEAPPVVEETGQSLSLRVKDPVLEGQLVMEPDLLVLSPAVEPRRDEKLNESLSLPLSADGFFLESHAQLRPVESYVDGIYLCGMAQFPKLINESAAQAKAAASKAGMLLAKGKVTVEPIVAEILRDRCTGCGVCESFCPYKAIRTRKAEKGKKAEVIAAACKGCGVCSSYCPARSIVMGRFTDEQILAQIEAFGEAWQ
jgi:heterodisulfide reductase subunit A